MLLRKFCFVVLVCYLIFFASVAIGQTSRFAPFKFFNAQKDSLQYQLLFPDYAKNQKYPLVIFLHGSGERGNDNEAQLKWGVSAFATDAMMGQYPAIVIAPQCPENQTWSSITENNKTHLLTINPTPSKPMELLIGLIKEMISKYAIDTNRIYITGLSMGGFGTYDAITRYPNLFAAAVPVCGGGDVSAVNTFKEIPIWIFHGAEDAAVDVQCSYDMANALVKAGAHPGLTIYPEVGHFSWIRAYSDLAMINWLFKQRKH